MNKLAALFVVAGASMLAACGKCAGKSGPELKTCEAVQEGASNSASLDCKDWGVLDGNVAESGDASASTCYRFTLAEVGHLRLTLSDATVVPLMELIQDDGDGVIQKSEVVLSNFDYVTRPVEIATALPKGEFSLRVSAGSGKFTLNSKFEEHPQSSPEEDPGVHPGSVAFALGVLVDGPATPLSGYVGKLDEADFYEIDLAKIGNLRISLSDSKVVPLVRIVRDDGDDVVQEAEILISNADYVTRPSELSIPLDKGRYYVGVSGADTTYTLNLSLVSHPTASPASDPGDEIGSALVIGDLSTTPVEFGGYVGGWDSADVFQFTVPSAGVAKVDITEAASAPLVEFIADDGDKVIQKSEVLASNFDYVSLPRELSWTVPARGTYWVRITSAPALYTLSLTFAAAQ